MDQFSDLVREYVKELDDNYHAQIPADRRGEIEQAGSIGRLVVAELVGSRLGFTTQSFLKQLEDVFRSVGSPELEEQFNEHYTRELLDLIPGFARRTVRLSLLLAQDLPSERIAVYLSEATRCYIFGFWAGCIALCRAALEGCLRDRLGEQLGCPVTLELKELIQASGRLRLLDAHAESSAREVQKAGNHALHPSSFSASLDEERAFEALSNLRGVLLYLYGG